MQHRLLVIVIALSLKLRQMVRKLPPSIRWGSLKNEKINIFRDKVILETSDRLVEDTNQMWEAMATTITHAARKTLGVTTGKTTVHKKS